MRSNPTDKKQAAVPEGRHWLNQSLGLTRPASSTLTDGPENDSASTKHMSRAACGLKTWWRRMKAVAAEAPAGRFQ